MPTPPHTFSGSSLVRFLAGGGFMLTLLSVIAQSCSAVPASQAPREENRRVIRPGVVHREIVDTRGPWRIQVLEIDLRHGDLVLETARALDSAYGRETTSAMVARRRAAGERVVAGLNADFFDMKTGEAINNQMAGGIVARGLLPALDERGEYRGVRSQIGFLGTGRPVLGKFVLDGKVYWKGGGSGRISGVNVVRARTDLVLFNRYIGPETPPDTLGRETVEILLERVRSEGDTLVAVMTGRGRGRSPVPREGCVLAAIRRPAFFDSAGVLPGDTVRLLLAFPPSPPGLRALAGGLPQLIRAGEIVLDFPDGLEGAARDFAEKRHPRTGIGFTADSAVVKFVVVDGRQSQSAGMTLREFALLMRSLGLDHALNLDGGGSTTLVIEGRVVNTPSDAAGERPVANAILLLERPPTGVQ